MILKKISLACMVLGGASFLSACGGGDGGSTFTLAPPVQVVTSNVKANATVDVIRAIGTTPVTFNNGFSGVDGSGNPVNITGVTTVAFSGTGASPNASITNGVSTASGPTTFGSCIFSFTTSNFPSTSPFAVGKSFKVDPCTLNVNTAGRAANGNSFNTTGSFTFGSNTSIDFSLPVVINVNGTITLNGVSLGSVTLSNITGGTN